MRLCIGTDIVAVSRIGRLSKNRKFLERIFTPEEIRYCQGKKNSAQHFAVRFAAKEAVWKALSSRAGVRGIAHKEISVQKAVNGQPYIQLSQRLKKFEKGIALSLSHTKVYAMAVAIYQGK